MISDELIAFMAVVEHMSFSKAATELFITQPAVSMRIAQLEEQLNQRLFLRDKRALKLTQAGQILFARSQSLLIEARNTKQQLNALQNLESGHLTIGISDTVCRYFLPRKLEVFIKAFPGIHLRFVNKATPEIIQLTEHHKVDVGFVLAPFDNRNLTYRPLFKYHDVLISSPSRAIKGLKDVERYPLLLLDQNTQSRQLIDEEISRSGLTPMNIIEVGNSSVQKEFVRIGLGLGILPDYALTKMDNYIVKKIPAFARREIGICTKPVNSENLLLQKFLECLYTDIKP